MSATELELPLRVVLLTPPAGVRFALQKGDPGARTGVELESAQTADGSDLAFDLRIRVRWDGDGRPRLLGPFVHGPTSGRFLYITVGQSAGQPDSPWKRRAKIPLSGITAAQIRAVSERPGAWLDAAVPGTLPDGSPTCATRPFAPGRAWQPAGIRGGR